MKQHNNKLTLRPKAGMIRGKQTKLTHAVGSRCSQKQCLEEGGALQNAGSDIKDCEHAQLRWQQMLLLQQ